MEQENSLRERLIDVGVDLVMTEGTGSLGLREIARRAGVSHGAPRRYFPTHHALLSAIARRGFADLAARFTSSAAGAATPRERIEALGRAYVGYALEHRGMFELMFRHDLLDSERQGGAPAPDQPRLRESTLPLFELFAGLVARCRTEDGQAPPAAVTAAALWANLHGVAQLWGWGSLPLVQGRHEPAQLDLLVTAALDAHLGPAPR
ncbi:MULTISPECIES: TetR/AcrR family transcriptional regulator [unclassified Streptomyces]|uniref:TetR/AcrR family transcriptional regulator n=1 Tax=unclassified Streptomyces TaxID=2593676 RepID=UPI002257EE8A|nr:MULTISPECIES: TetR/AcrR family transcriptional regulator [unclassified Streptomyces]MCX4529801.1 TetR/AcrR family transcriptional regulator [Streptomyces sp. NBC_01551]MCX4539627.1 TetR/AcrR family transcriptional regulator [Streptomyces sp. NBC_01565]